MPFRGHTSVSRKASSDMFLQNTPSTGRALTAGTA